MTIEVVADKVRVGAWRVEEIWHHREGECLSTVFYGTDSELRARKYAAWRSVSPQIIEEVYDEGTVWSLSLNGPNPNPEDSISCDCKEDAERLYWLVGGGQ